MNVILFLVLYFIILNIISFVVMGMDKKKAIKHLFRIPEATLFILALIGGSIGSILGMYTFRHKTQHWYFVYGMPLILALQLGILSILFLAPIHFKTL